MEQVIAAIGMILSGMMKLGLPPEPPTIVAMPVAQIQAAACNGKCDNVYFFTEPTTGKIFVPDNVDFSFTLARAELAREVARYILIQHKIYSPNNSCSDNVKLENTLRDIEWDYIELEKKKQTYKGHGVPQQKTDLAEHIFFCVPDDKVKPRKKDYKQGEEPKKDGKVPQPGKTIRLQDTI